MILQQSLYELQKHFTECLFDNEKSAQSLSLNKYAPDTADKRLDIYRNNVFFSLTAALADLYPVVKKLVGTEFFNGMARVYLQSRPPAKAAMIHFGGDFPGFLEALEQIKDHGYLVDIARLELAWHQAYHAADAAPLSAADLAGVPPERLAQSGIRLHPSLRLVRSPFPILKIWNANQDETADHDKINLDSGGEMVCVFRPDYEVRIKQLDPGSFVFLSKLSNGTTIEEAIHQVFEEDPGFAADRCLAMCLTEGLFMKTTGGIDVEKNCGNNQ
jgi:hypothetical protein